MISRIFMALLTWLPDVISRRFFPGFHDDTRTRRIDSLLSFRFQTPNSKKDDDLGLMLLLVAECFDLAKA